MQLTIVFLLACCHFFGPALSQKRQYGGYDVNIRQYPFVVAISLGGQTTGSGAIIAPRWILSSASAFLVPYHDSYKVNVGADAVGGGQWYQGQMVYQHPEWEGFQDNIALLKTNRKIKFGPTAQPIKLFESNPDGIDNALMLSYGENEQELVGNGAIIAPRWILSSASAFQVTPHSEYIAHAGGDVYKDGERYPSEAVYKHPEWNGYVANIALMKLKWKLKFGAKVKPIKLFQQDLDRVDDVFMISYGKNALGTKHLQGAPYFLTSDAACLASLNTDYAKAILQEGHGYCKRQYGGYDVTASEFPFVVAIAFGVNLTGNGAILAPKWILSTADAFLKQPLSEYEAYAGGDSLENGERYRNERIYPHQESYGYIDNIALMKLKRELRFGPTIMPIRMLESNPDGMEVLMLSFGKNEDGSKHLRAAQYILASDAACVAHIEDERAKSPTTQKHPTALSALGQLRYANAVGAHSPPPLGFKRTDGFSRSQIGAVSFQKIIIKIKRNEITLDERGIVEIRCPSSQRETGYGLDACAPMKSDSSSSNAVESALISVVPRSTDRVVGKGSSISLTTHAVTDNTKKLTSLGPTVWTLKRTNPVAETSLVIFHCIPTLELIRQLVEMIGP
uniref:Uncharacterized protein n=1 Tax=Anopheles atroparvus TaxID=41427 RepID=A0A182JLG0_ANOAO